MNIRELLLIVGLALITSKGIEYLFFPKTADGVQEIVNSGDSFTAPKAQQVVKPLNTEVDFVDTAVTSEPILTEVETAHAHFVFSSYGASLQKLTFKRNGRGVRDDIETITPVADTDREERCFLVGLTEKTPYQYQLVAREDTDESIVLQYQAEFYAGRILKTFTVSKATCQLAVKIQVIPTVMDQPVQIRLLYPAPIMKDIAATDQISGLVNDKKDFITMHSRDAVAEKGWFAPTFFGAENRYFVHAMIADHNKFVQRGYYKLSGRNDLFSILEGPEKTGEQSWTLLFYFGPKEREIMASVDPRLEQTLGFSGWFGILLFPIAKWLLVLLNMLFAYFGSYGWAIIAITVLIKLILLPFSLQGARSSKKNSEMQRKLRHLQQKYKDNPERLAEERMELMRKEGLGLSGCLPLLIQIPIFIALSRLLSSAIELYQAPFFVWKDLAAPDQYYILPGLIMISMLIQATTVPDNQRMTLVVGALVLGAFGSNLSAGLCLYIVVSTILGVMQSFVQNRFKLA
ncbi:MAG TPA: YidC/Oxa1 family insertase periplasmic-domain containing protein [Candidatus Babeliales bacterium]|nr:YidC/Oxa1 family insertase periplasmic-domain containing protein [Candidatus Babeliales bacterium]